MIHRVRFDSLIIAHEKTLMWLGELRHSILCYLELLESFHLSDRDSLASALNVYQGSDQSTIKNCSVCRRVDVIHIESD